MIVSFIRNAAIPLSLAAAVMLSFAGLAQATPSTNFWAPSTPAVQGYGVLHLTYDTYFDPSGLYPIDTGLQIGVLPGKSFQAEVGFDLLYPTVAAGDPVEFPILLNAKVGAPEDVYFKGCPAWSAGIYSAGFEKDVTDYNVLHGMIGKTFPLGMVSVGGYYGLNENLFRSSEGEDQRGGFMAGWFSPAIDTPLIDRIHFTWDIQSGKNVFGATGGGVYFYVTPTVDVLTGPVFFFDENLQPGGASWMWSMQVDVDIPVIGGK
jgi:hypothetical protein